MTEQENREKEICVTKEDFEISEIIHQTIGCSYKCYECRRYNKECKDYAIVKQLKSYYERKEEEVRKECDKNAYNAWKGAFGVKEKAIREEVRKEAIKEFVETVKRSLPNEPYVHTHIRAIASVKFGVEVEK